MLNIMLTGVGGQGTVLAAKVLAQAAQEKGWHVRTAETIGMAQRGGSVVSHVRMGNNGEEVHAPLIARGTADLVIAFEPAEGARVLPYLSSDGWSVTAALSDDPYRAEQALAWLRGRSAGQPEKLVEVDDAAILEKIGNRKALNTVLLAKALSVGHIPLDLADLKSAIEVCVKPRFVELNLKAIEAAQ